MSRNSSKATRRRQLWLVPSSGEAGRAWVAEAALALPLQSVRSYAIPNELRDVIRPGAWLRVPHGRRAKPVDALCLRVSEQAWDQTRPPVLDAKPGPDWLSPELVEVGLWVSDYYACQPYKTFRALLPAGVAERPAAKTTMVKCTEHTDERRITEKQQRLLDTLGGQECERRTLLRRAGVSSAVLQALCKRGLVECSTQDAAAVSYNDASVEVPPSPADSFELTPGQSVAINRICRQLHADAAFRVFLLFGVPGSGKTEVYVRTARDVVAAGRQVILLIPEIALATQVVDRLMRRFGRVAVLHSQLTARTRRDTLHAIASGNVDVVIGTRTAVFAPCPRLGLIVVDEEQETSFKNLAAPYYHARDVAIKRAQIESIPVVLGSATPSLESWHNVHHRAHYELLRLPDRVPGAELPRTRRVVREQADLGQLEHTISPTLLDEIRVTLEAAQQVILLHNRRGYAAYLRCDHCGLMVNCPRCNSHLVYHQTEHTMKCHRCGMRVEVPRRCPDDTCAGRLVRTGAAIQQLEEELQRAVPDARLLRLDRDTMRRREDYRAALEQFEQGGADILLGTQMVAKGLDFPRVRLVGVIDADAALSLPDFRAGERVFQLIVQVVGRAGRQAGASLAMVQTGPEARSIVNHALRMDYEAFAEPELTARARHGYPPATRMVRLILTDGRPHRAREEATRLGGELTRIAATIDARVRVHQAEACVMRQLRDMLRWQIVVCGPAGPVVQQLLHAAHAARLLRPRVQRFAIDVDPVELL